MNEQIKQIAERLRGLRDVLELTAEDIARDSDISAEEYRQPATKASLPKTSKRASLSSKRWKLPTY